MTDACELEDDVYYSLNLNVFYSTKEHRDLQKYLDSYQIGDVDVGTLPLLWQEICNLEVKTKLTIVFAEMKSEA